MALHSSQHPVGKYQRIYGHDDFDSLSADDKCQYLHENLRYVNLWKFSTFFFQLTTLISLILLFNKYHEKTYQLGFPTEFRSVLTESSAFSLKPIRFHSPLANSTYRTKYVADPSPEIDAVWNELIKNRYFWVTEEEAKAFLPTSYKQYYHKYSNKGFQETSGYIMGLDVLHTLHCVNMLRKALSPEYYYPHGDPEQLHIYHCIDHIRQVIMCYADLTPIPGKWYGTFEAIDADQVHMCRDFDAIREWANGRNHTIPPR